MGFLDNLPNNNDYARLGITADQAKELDLLDGKEDNKINGKSIFEVVENAKRDYESSEANHKKTFINYLKDFYIPMQINMQKFNPSNITWHINVKPEDIAEELIKEIFKFGRSANLDKPISKINSKNVVEVIEKYQEKSRTHNVLTGTFLDANESLFEAILDENIGNSKKREYLEHIKNALVKKVENLGGDASKISEDFSTAITNALSNTYGFQSASELNNLYKKFIKIINQLETLNNANKEDDSAELTDAQRGIIERFTDDYYPKTLGIGANDVLGNGSFDNAALQMAGNCWAHAGINSTLKTPAGKQYVNNLVVKDKQKGTISVLLPGAKDAGLPKPKGDGIYTYSENEIYNSTFSTSAGDGDYTAMMLAIEDFRQESTGNEKATTDAGNALEIFRLLFGKEHSDKNTRIVPSNYESLIELFESRKYALYVSAPVGAELLHGKDFDEESLTGSHALSIESIDPKYGVVLKDSRCPNTSINVDMDEFLEKFTVLSCPIPE